MGSDLFIVIAIGVLIGLILFILGKYVELANNYYKGKKINRKLKMNPKSKLRPQFHLKPIVPFVTLP